MDLFVVAFYLFSLLTLGSATVMVLAKKIIHAAFALMFALLGIAALYVLLYADFVAATQVLVYVGGILILILFGIMLTSQEFTASLRSVTVNILPASVLTAIVAAILLFAFFNSHWETIDFVERESTTYDLGIMLMNEYMLPFQVTGVLLLVAIIGAMMIATRSKGSQKSPEHRKSSITNNENSDL